MYREEREGEIEVQKKSLCRIWRLRVNDKDWSNKEDVTCIGKERVKVQMVSPLDLGSCRMKIVE